MLETLRNATKSWVAYGFIGLLILSFAIWGISDIFTAQIDRTVARVGGAEIDAQVFEDRLQGVIRNQQRDDPTFDAAKAIREGLDRRVLDAMIADQAMMQEAEALGIGASDAMVVAAVREDVSGAPGIVDAEGRIDSGQLRRALADAGLSEADYLAQKRFEAVSNQIFDAVGPAGPPPTRMAVAMLAYENERRAIEFVAVPDDRAGEIPAPDDAALQAHLDANAGRFGAPEYRKLAVLSVSPRDFLAAIDVPEERIRALYDSRKAEYDKPETRALTQLAFESEADAKAARALIDEGKGFDEVAAAGSPKGTLAELGAIAKTDAGPLAPAFEAAEGDIVGPVVNAFGVWVLVKVGTVTPGEVTPYEAVREALREEIARPEARRRLEPFVTAFEDAFSEGQSLEALAKAQNLPLRIYDAVDARGNGADGLPVPGLPGGESMLNVAFAADQGDPSPPQQSRDGTLFFVRVDGVTPAGVRPLSEIRSAVAADWTAKERASRLKAVAEEFAAKGAAGAASEAIASELGAPLSKIAPTARDAGDGPLPTAAIEALFGKPAGTWMAVELADGGAAVARVSEVTHASAEDGAVTIQQMGQATASAIARDLVDLYRDAVTAAHAPEVNEEMLRRLQQPGS